jgi:hypothetical protein
MSGDGLHKFNRGKVMNIDVKRQSWYNWSEVIVSEGGTTIKEMVDDGDQRDGLASEMFYGVICMYRGGQEAEGIIKLIKQYMSDSDVEKIAKSLLFEEKGYDWGEE